MRVSRVVLMLVATAFSALSAGALSADQTGPPARDCQPAVPRVRSEEPRLRALLERGLFRSPTLKTLVSELNDSDVIVFITWLSSATRSDYGGYLLNRVVLAGGYRYLLISVNGHSTDDRVIALIAHELQHALEVARVSEVGRTMSVQELFRKIATVPCGRGDCFETIDAIRVQDAVMQELD